MELSVQCVSIVAMDVSLQASKTQLGNPLLFRPSIYTEINSSVNCALYACHSSEI